MYCEDMRVQPGGCLLSVLSLLGLGALGVVWFVIAFVGGFNDNGDPEAAAGIGWALLVVGGLMVLAGVLVAVGLVWAVNGPWLKDRRVARPKDRGHSLTSQPSVVPGLHDSAVGHGIDSHLAVVLPQVRDLGSSSVTKPSGMPVGQAVLTFGGLLVIGTVLPTGCYKLAIHQHQEADRVRMANDKATAERISPLLRAALVKDATLQVISCPDDAPSNLYMADSMCFVSQQDGLKVGEAYRRALVRLNVDELERNVEVERDEGSAFTYINDPHATGDEMNAVQFRMEYFSRSEVEARGTDRYINPRRVSWWAKQKFNTFLAVEPQIP